MQFWSFCTRIFSFCCCWCCCIVAEFLRSSRNALLHKWFTLISFHQSLYFLPHLLFNDLSCDCTTLLFTLHSFIYSYMYFYTHTYECTHRCVYRFNPGCVWSQVKIYQWRGHRLLFCCCVKSALLLLSLLVGWWCSKCWYTIFFRIFVMSLSLSLHTVTLWLALWSVKKTNNRNNPKG